MTADISDDGLDLLAQCVEANVRSAAWTTDRLIELERNLRLSMAETFAELYDALAKVPYYSRPAFVDHLLMLHAPAREQVQEWREEMAQ